MRRATRTIVSGAIWFGLLALGVLALVLPKRQHLPEGWQVSKEPGAVLAMAEAGGVVYLAGYEGLYKAEPATPLKLTKIELPKECGKEVYALATDPVGGLWLGCRSGLFKYAAGQVSKSCNFRNNVQPAVKAIAQNPEGVLWLGTDQGLYRFQPAVHEGTVAGTAEAITGAPCQNISAVLPGENNDLWIGTYCAPSGGVGRFDGSSWKWFTPQDGLPHANVTSIVRLDDGRIVAGCGFRDRGGAAFFTERKPGSWELEGCLGSGQLAGPKVRSILQDSQSRLWLGSEQDGLTIRSRNETLTIVTTEDGLPSPEVMCILESRDHAIWLGTLSGVVCINPMAAAELVSREH